MVTKKILPIISAFEQRFYEISEDRIILLNHFAEYIAEKVKDGKEINLMFICTHNSRRSIMSQIWAQAASEYFKIPEIKCYSGGTEVTAFNPRAIKAIRKAGFKVERMDDTNNPIYLVYYSDKKEPVKCFSKVYNHPINPKENFAAIMTCSDADENCPVILGVEKRFPLKYNDPKVFDGTKLEEPKYSERFEQIGIEMLYTMSKVVL